MHYLCILVNGKKKFYNMTDIHTFHEHNSDATKTTLHIFGNKNALKTVNLNITIDEFLALLEDYWSGHLDSIHIKQCEGEETT